MDRRTEVSRENVRSARHTSGGRGEPSRVLLHASDASDTRVHDGPDDQSACNPSAAAGIHAEHGLLVASQLPAIEHAANVC